MTAPVDLNQFQILQDGSITPQPWMQWRLVASVANPAVSGSYAVSTAYDTDLNEALTESDASVSQVFDASTEATNETLGVIDAALGTELLGGVAQPLPTTAAGGAKNDLLYQLMCSWTNVTPINQWVYGLITRGGQRMTVQARTQAYILVLSGEAVSQNSTPATPVLTLSSAFGCGADTGLGGELNVGAGYCIIEERMNATSFYVQPEIAGWINLAPGETYTAAMQVRYASPNWETQTIDGGNVDTDTSYEDGGSRLDIFAVPVLPVELSNPYYINQSIVDAPVPGAATAALLTMLGGGGGGAGGLSSTDGGGGGGGGGALVTVEIPVSDLGATYSLIQGLPGSAGAPGENGGAGSASTFSSGSVSLSAGGGQGGSGTTGGAGGTASASGVSGATTYNGGAGGDGGTVGSPEGVAAADVTTGAAAGGGGGGCGVVLLSGNGGPGGNSATQQGGQGGNVFAVGSTPLPAPDGQGGAGGGGGGGIGLGADVLGQAGAGAAGGSWGGGGGGGGGQSDTDGNADGGQGAPAFVSLQWLSNLSALTVVQTASGAFPLSFINPVTKGNTVIILAGCTKTTEFTADTPIIAGPTLNGATVAGSFPIWNTSATDTTFNPAGTDVAAIFGWVLPNCPAANGLTFTTVASGVTAPGMVAYEVSGLGTIPQLLTGASNDGNGTTAYSDETGLVTDVPALLVGAAMAYGEALTAPSGFTAHNIGTADGWGGYQIINTTGSGYAWSQTVAAASNWAAGIAAIIAGG
jgi:hypothetical protein